MEFDLRALARADAYKLLASVIVPRPIALVTTLGAGGEVNAAPFSFFNMLGSDPPVVALGVGDRAPGAPKDTRANIVRTGEFVVTLVDEGLAGAMNVCAVDFPPGVDELREAGLTTVPSAALSVPRIAEGRVHLECRLLSLVEAGRNQILIGEVVFLHIQDALVDAARLRVRTEDLGLIGRMHGGGWYARTTDLFDMPRLTYAEWQVR